MDDSIDLGEVRVCDGKKAIIASFGIWAEKNDSGVIHIHMTGDGKNFQHITVTNQKGSKRHHRVLFRNLRRLLIDCERWPYGEEGNETEEP